MTAYADLDVSIIDELPPGRTPVKTVVLAEARRDEVVMRIRTACLEGRQAYWVCPLIDESEEMPYQAAEETAAALAAALPELRVGLVHGRMPSAAQGVDHEPVQARRAPAAGGHDRHRGRRRRTECQLDGHRERRAHGSRTIAPAPRPGGPGRTLRAPASCCTGRRSRRWLASGWGSCATPTTASWWHAAIWNCAAPANSWEPARPGWRKCGWPTSPATRTCCRRCRSRRRSCCSIGPRTSYTLVRRWVGHAEQYGRVG